MLDMLRNFITQVHNKIEDKISLMISFKGECPSSAALNPSTLDCTVGCFRIALGPSTLELGQSYLGSELYAPWRGAQ